MILISLVFVIAIVLCIALWMTMNWYRNFMKYPIYKPLPSRVAVSRPNEEKILIPYKYFTERTKKDFLVKLIDGANEWYGVPEEYVPVLREIAEMLFAAGIIMDDVEDGSLMRRGEPTAHVKYGIPATVNAANYIYFLAQEKITKELPPDMVQDALNIVIEGMLGLHIGQGLEIYWRDRFICPTEEEYRAMVIQKTGTPILAGYKVGALFNSLYQDECREHFIRFIELMMLFVQIRDDYANLVSKYYAKSKTFAEDITEGKFSFPVIHCIRSNPDDTRLLDILKMRTTDLELKQEAVQIMQEAGSLEYTFQACLKLEDELDKQMDLIYEIVEKSDKNTQLVYSNKYHEFVKKEKNAKVVDSRKYHEYVKKQFMRYSPRYINTDQEPTDNEIYHY